MAAAGLSYLEPEEVVELLQGPAKEKTVVVDVRDEHELADGFVKGAINMPSGQFLDSDAVDKFIEEQLQGKSTIVVHCKLSQKRGPQSAAVLAARLQELAKADHNVVVLRGGYAGFSAKYGDAQPQLIERLKQVDRALQHGQTH